MYIRLWETHNIALDNVCFGKQHVSSFVIVSFSSHTKGDESSAGCSAAVSHAFFFVKIKPFSAKPDPISLP